MKEFFWILLFHFGLGAVVQPSPRSSPRVLADTPASASGLLERIEHLSFGYERVSGAANVGMRSRPVRNSLNSSVPVATQVRPRGCEFLLRDSGTGSDPLMTSKFTFDTLEQLPCVTLGSLIFLRFACIYGHEWTAVRGSYSTANCPQCVPSSRSRLQKNARKRPLDSEKSLASRLAQHAEAKGGKLLLPSSASTITSSSLPLRWKSKVEFQCSKGHKFSVVASNAIKQKNWCAVCLHGPDQMHRTAEYFGGRFVGMVEDEPMTSKNLHEDYSQESRPRRRPRSLSLARWRCADGHEFQQTINNIRRSVGGSRGCSWCPSCTKLGKKFVWRGDACLNQGRLSESERGL